MSRGLILLLASIFWLAAGCDKGELGYVQIRVAPASAAMTMALYLDGRKLDFSREASVTLRLETGKLALKSSDSAWAPAICSVLVRKDRISALTVTATPAAPRCVCEIRAPESDTSAVICA